MAQVAAKRPHECARRYKPSPVASAPFLQRLKQLSRVRECPGRCPMTRIETPSSPRRTEIEIVFSDADSSARWLFLVRLSSTCNRL